VPTFACESQRRGRAARRRGIRSGPPLLRSGAAGAWSRPGVTSAARAEHFERRTEEVEAGSPGRASAPGRTCGWAPFRTVRLQGRAPVVGLVKDFRVRKSVRIMRARGGYWWVGERLQEEPRLSHAKVRLTREGVGQDAGEAFKTVDQRASAPSVAAVEGLQADSRADRGGRIMDRR
jgi:hypothetical protein